MFFCVFLFFALFYGPNQKAPNRENSQQFRDEGLRRIVGATSLQHFAGNICAEH